MAELEKPYVVGEKGPEEVFIPPTPDGFVVITHRELGATSEIPTESLGTYKARGWVETSELPPPPEPEATASTEQEQ